MLVTLTHKMTARAPGITFTFKTQKEETKNFSIMRLINFLVSEGNAPNFHADVLHLTGQNSDIMGISVDKGG